MLDRLQKIKHRLSVKGRGYDLTKDVEVTDLFDDFEWLIDSLEVAIKARDGHFKEIERLQNIIRHVHELSIKHGYDLVEKYLDSIEEL